MQTSRQSSNGFPRHPSLQYNKSRASIRSTRVSGNGLASKSPGIRRTTSDELPPVFKRLSIKPSPSKGAGRAWKLSDFQFGRRLGQGKFGKVLCAKEKSSGFICALKIMKKSELKKANIEAQFIREVEIQANIRHVNCARIYDWFQDENNVYLILELAANGELYKPLRENKKFDDAHASYYTYQLVDALIYLHSKNIIHRDLKPENILLHFNNTIKVSDFGWSVYSPQSDRKRDTLCGTLDYLSPEIATNKPYDYTVDVWTLGVLIYEFLVGRPPFERPTSSETTECIRNVSYDIPSFVSPDAADLIEKLLQRNPQDRLSLKEIKTHPWILKNKSSWSKITS